jgi:hypothetical protein
MRRFLGTLVGGAIIYGGYMSFGMHPATPLYHLLGSALVCVGILIFIGAKI